MDLFLYTTTSNESGVVCLRRSKHFDSTVLVVRKEVHTTHLIRVFACWSGPEVAFLSKKKKVLCYFFQLKNINITVMLSAESCAYVNILVTPRNLYLPCPGLPVPKLCKFQLHFCFRAVI